MISFKNETNPCVKAGILLTCAISYYEKLYPSSYIKYIGIQLDENLNWRQHDSILSSKLRRVDGALAKVRHFIPRP